MRSCTKVENGSSSAGSDRSRARTASLASLRDRKILMFTATTRLLQSSQIRIIGSVSYTFADMRRSRVEAPGTCQRLSSGGISSADTMA